MVILLDNVDILMNTVYILQRIVTWLHILIFTNWVYGATEITQYLLVSITIKIKSKVCVGILAMLYYVNIFGLLTELFSDVKVNMKDISKAS